MVTFFNRCIAGTKKKGRCRRVVSSDRPEGRGRGRRGKRYYNVHGRFHNAAMSIKKSMQRSERQKENNGKQLIQGNV